MGWLLDNLDLIASLTVDHFRQSAIATVLGFALAVPIGWAAFRYTRLRGTVLSIVGVLYTIPSLGLFGVLSATLGISFLSELNLVIALTIYAVAIMTRSVVDGFVSVQPVTRQAAEAIGFDAWRRFWQVDLRLAIPVLMAGLRVTVVSTIALASVGALIGIDNLGYLFTNGSQRRIVAEVLTGVVVIGLLSFVADRLILLLGNLLTPWLRKPRASGARA